MARQGLPLGPTHGLPVDRDLLEFQAVRHRRDERAEARLERPRSNNGEDPVEGVVRGNAVGQLEPESRAEPRLLGAGECRHADEVVGPADGRDDDDEQDVQELVIALECDPWVRKVREVVGQSARGGRDDSAPREGAVHSRSRSGRRQRRIGRNSALPETFKPRCKPYNCLKSLAISCNCPVPPAVTTTSGKNA